MSVIVSAHGIIWAILWLRTNGIDPSGEYLNSRDCFVKSYLGMCFVDCEDKERHFLADFEVMCNIFLLIP
jgi:hypothetical protein